MRTLTEIRELRETITRKAFEKQDSLKKECGYQFGNDEYFKKNKEYVKRATFFILKSKAKKYDSEIKKMQYERDNQTRKQITMNEFIFYFLNIANLKDGGLLKKIQKTYPKATKDDILKTFEMYLIQTNNI